MDFGSSSDVTYEMDARAPLQKPSSPRNSNSSDQSAPEDMSEQQLAEPACPSPEQQALEKRTIRKLDFILLPYLALIFLFNSLDRSNIGNAETANFMADVGLDRNDLNTAMALFFAFFVALQPVGAAAGRRVGTTVWVPGCMTAWGCCTLLHIWINARWQLYSLRITIGILEAGFYPVTVSYLSLFYTRYEFGRRLALFYGQYALAGALGGILSYAVFSHFGQTDPAKGDGEHGDTWHGWQYLFLVEGGATIIIALIGFFYLPRNAGTAWFLTKEERRWAERRIQEDRVSTVEGLESAKSVGQSTEDEEEPGQEPSEGHHLLSRSVASLSSQHFTDSRGLTPHDILSALLSPKIYQILSCNILSSVPVTAFSVFLPLVLKSLAPSSAIANLLTAPPYLCGAAVLYAFTSWSDRHEERLRPVLVSLIVLLFGLLLVVVMPETKGWAYPRYIALCILLSGTFVASPLTIAWVSGNTPAPGKRALMLGLNGWGNLAGLISAMIFSPRFAPTYKVSFWLSAICVGVSAAGYAMFRFLLIRENESRRKLVASWDVNDLHAEELEGKGPAGRDGRQKPIEVVVSILAWLKLEQASSWVKAVQEEGREGDEKLTFLYGL